MADNTVTLVGNLTRDPELRFTSSGQAVASFGLAVNRRFQRNGQWEENTSFFNITCWSQMAENAATSLGKGSRVLVTGRLEQRSYESQGEKRSVVEVIADEIGPSLRWATAEVTRNERRTPDDAGGMGGSSRPVPNEDMGSPTYGHDEEPF
jgi:single-strand DNA-binding protein